MPKWLLVLLLVLCLTFSAPAQDLVLGCIPSNGPPYFIGPPASPEGGIFYDLAQAVAIRLGVQARFVEIPRGRLEEKLHEGAFNVIPVFHPSWADLPDRLIFSPPLVPEKNVLITWETKADMFWGAADLKGLRLGAIRGYYYHPNFQGGVNAGLYIREDVADHRQNFEKLLLGRVDAFVIADLIGVYHLKINPRYQGLRVCPFVISEQYLYWAFSAHQPELAGKVSRVLEELQDQGEITRILRKYR